MSEIPGDKFDPLQFWNWGARDLVERITDQKQTVSNGKTIKDSETKNNNNTLTVTTGDYPAYTPSVINTGIVGQGDLIFKPTGTDQLSTASHIILDTKISNARFEGTVLVADNATAIFQNCVFTNSITVQAGSNAHFIGCLFQDVGSVLNSGTAYIIGCSRKSTVAHAGITATFGETT